MSDKHLMLSQEQYLEFLRLTRPHAYILASIALRVQKAYRNG